MRLHELTSLIERLDGRLKLGLEATPPIPIISTGTSADHFVLITGSTDHTPLTVAAFKPQLIAQSTDLLIVSPPAHRIFGIRQSDGWLLFK
ncbi:hypothetical protein [Secundilactobacillus kimchicus]|uniref:Uncharacterized protein n=1 Tax=Secundilactobacillus kimchicus JCM 15530 TaxID=1302272 RepID=A0A0R1I0J4_9LACO|nr:hypothetical protein [Secundilactobacillus kimchicus]KRK49473.1 hypothetical protein FC96_GL000404 [Secundilactobacillus kimchicus JCM 15530]MBT9673020.1 hypothetical protein [Secundilactobacillus kimchicus]